MKRSEAVKLLIETMGTYDSWEQQCSYMLEILEDAGMFPPLNMPEGVEEELAAYCEWEDESQDN